MTPDDVKAALPTIAARCEEIDRDPASLSISVHIWRHNLPPSGQQRRDLLAGYREAGVARIQSLVETCWDTDEALIQFAEDCRLAGAELA